MLLKNIAEVVVSFWVVGLELKSFVEKFYELIISPLHSADRRQIAIDNVIVCSSGNQVSINRLCFLKLPLIDECNGLLLLGSLIHRTLGVLLFGDCCWLGG